MTAGILLYLDFCEPDHTNNVLFVAQLESLETRNNLPRSHQWGVMDCKIPRWARVQGLFARKLPVFGVLQVTDDQITKQILTADPAKPKMYLLVIFGYRCLTTVSQCHLLQSIAW